MRKQELYIDPRTKIFLLLTMNIVLLNTGTGDFVPYLRFAVGLLPFLMFLLSGKRRMAGGYLMIYLLSYYIMVNLLPVTGGILMMLLGFLTSIGTRFMPGGMMGVYFICSTRVNEFVAAMECMHVPDKITIPVSVMFRFFPTVGEEARGISDAMRMRKLGFAYFFSRPAEILEYRMVPLMISVVNTGEDLSASALTRCLGMYKDRTNISRCGFGIPDVVLFLVGLIFIALYLLDLGGLI